LELIAMSQGFFLDRQQSDMADEGKGFTLGVEKI